MIASETNPYKALGVDSKASQEDIKAAYRKLAKKLHPDLNPGNKIAESRFKEVTSAYNEIGTEKSRADYDLAQNQKQNYGRRSSGDFEHDDQDIFNSFFSQMRRNQARPQKPTSEIYQIDVEFKDAILGGQRELTLPSGKSFLVKIPAGVLSGVKLKFAGQGATNDQGTADVYVQLNVLESTQFRRSGSNLETEVSVPLSVAILGGELSVPTVDGVILMKIPPNITSDQKIRAKGKGAFDSTTMVRGDQIVTLKIKMPDKVDAEFSAAVEAWAKRTAPENK